MSVTTAVWRRGARAGCITSLTPSGSDPLSAASTTAVGKTLVTGGSGFLGTHLVRALAARGDGLRLLARRSSSLYDLADVEFQRSTGDVTDRRAVRRRAMEGVERVFHVVGRTSMRPQRPRQGVRPEREGNADRPRGERSPRTSRG